MRYSRIFCFSHSARRNAAFTLVGFATLGLLVACSDGAGSGPVGSGGMPTSGSGGAAPSSGGNPAQQGGAPSLGGSPSSGGSATSGGASQGGSMSSGGAVTSGGSAAGGASSKGGASSGGSTNGGAGSGGSGGSTKGGGGSAGSGGSGNNAGTGSGGAPVNGGTFSQCRFHFGTIDANAKSGGSSLISQLDFFTPGWMLNETFDQAYVCTEGNPGGALANQVPLVVTYIAANYAKKHHGLCDCNVTSCGTNNDLCHYGAQYISEGLTAIVNAYKSYSQGYANCYGTTRPIIFAMEPDFYQYTTSSQTQPWTPARAGQIMGEFVAALKSSLPNARFSLDISPWVAPNNGGDHGAQWFSNFDMSLFTFVNTSGGGTSGNTAKIRSSNNMTWAGLSAASKKPILADTGYGASGTTGGHDVNWDSATNLNARIADGVVSISQYNPNSSWGTTISGVRGQLNAPKTCP
jgi:hypothetical protein